MSDSLIFLHLVCIKDLAPGTVDRLVARKPDFLTWSEIYTLSLVDLQKIFGFREKAAQKIYYGLRDKSLLEKELALIEKHDVSWASLFDADYPEALRTIQYPPAIVYWQGSDLNAPEKRIAIVGARIADQYGHTVIDAIVPELVGNGWTIVSGGAAGADTMAHEATLRAGGKTIVVVGSGLLLTYPPENKTLFKQSVDQGGTVISIFPMLTEPDSPNFPARNRVIAGLSRGCVVVQAAHRSGALITARFALEQGKEVFAVPGMVHNKLSEGCHALIQEGAKLVTSAADIVAEFGEIIPKLEDEAADEHGQQTIQPATKLPKNSKKGEFEAPLSGPETDEAKVMRLCQRPCSVDELIEGTHLSLSTLQILLFDLHLNGRIDQTMTGLWHISPNLQK